MTAEDEERLRERWRTIGRISLQMLIAVGMTMAGQAIPASFEAHAFNDLPTTLDEAS
ncbi:MAG TPA: hypothetical protein VGM75_16960 [Pseudonocardiaceae bacterium]